MTNMKVSSKMHLFIIITCILVAIGIAVGIVCNFVAGGYFNYGGEWTDYKSITVSYKYVDFSGNGDPKEAVTDICETAFENCGVSYYVENYGTTSTGGEIVYRFSVSADDTKLEQVKSEIESLMKTAIGSDTDVILSSVSVHSSNTLLGGGYALTMAAVAIASVIAVQFAYFVIRYKLSMAFASLLANVHNLAIYVSLLALCRVPVAGSAVTFGVLVVVLTMIGCALLFDRMRKIGKDESLSKLSSFEQTDMGAAQTLKLNLVVPAVLVALAAVIFVLMSISALSVTAVLAPVLCALVCFVSCAYGTAFFTPSVYSRFKQIGDNYAANHVKASKKKDEKVTPTVRRGRRAALSATPATPAEDETSEKDGE